MKLIRILFFITVIVSNNASAQGTVNGFFSPGTADTIYHPFIQDKQLIEINYLGLRARAMFPYQTMDQYPWWLEESFPATNELFFRDRSGKILLSFNSSANWDTLSRQLKPAGYVTTPTKNPTRELPYFNSYDSYLLPFGSGFYQTSNCTIEQQILANMNRRSGTSDSLLQIPLYGMIDSLGNQIIPNKYDDFYAVNYGFVTRRSSFYGIIDYSGKELLPPVYNSFQQEEDFCYFTSGHKWQAAIFKQKTIFIDTSTCSYPLVAHKGLFIKKEQDLLGIVDIRSGKTVIPCLFESINNYYYSERAATTILIVRKNGKYGLLDENGWAVIPIDYDNILFYRAENNGKIACEKEGKTILVQPKFRN